ncbi:MAG: hypothetical protein GF388_09595 [Candidatus Aegiribacteria sp.]|nr:hypothetical protein [Candidatus Aegiribacteria sp.]MBD3295296.1 hypothetical protein [Candidatus Fermentibacteria bacterium]
MKLLWYVSAHGWGHAARQRELIRFYSKRHPSDRISVCSEVPRWFWKGTRISHLFRGPPAPWIHEEGWNLDLIKTDASLMRFLQNLDNHLWSEIRFQKNQKPDIVISDIDPLPLAAAARLGIKAIAVGNFTWDWIFRRLFPRRKKEAEALAHLYRDAVHLKLPLGPDHSPCRQSIDVPLLRGGRNCNGTIPEDLLPPGGMCLFALRSLPGVMNVDLPQGYTAFSSLPEPLSEGIKNVPPMTLLKHGLSFSDLVAASDIVVSKAGYGIVSQILSMGKRCVIYTGRGFPEEPFLIESMKNRPSTKILHADATEDLSAAVEEGLSGIEPEKVEAEGCEFIVGGGYLTSSCYE